MLGNLLKPELEQMVEAKDYAALREVFVDMHPADVAEVIEDLPGDESALLFRVLPRESAALAFEYLPLEQQSEVVTHLGTEALVNILNEMAPDDRTRLFEELPAEVTKRVLTSLSPDELKVARQLLGYPEDTAGRFMTPEYVSLRAEMTAAQALEHIRRHGKTAETLNVVYLVDEGGKLLEDIRLSELVLAAPDTRVSDINDRAVVSIPATATKDQVVAAFEKYDRVALPVTDSQGVLVGIITVDDVLDVAEEQATEDIHQLGGLEALEAPYFDVGLGEMLRKRGVWLTLLLGGGMLTTAAMSVFQDDLSRAAVLALFLPLIISSGGNSGGQATSIIIRSLALQEVQLSDWWKVARRELVSGGLLGLALGLIGALRVLVPGLMGSDAYGGHYLRVSLTIAISLSGVVLLGNLVGSMLPFVLSRFRVDPAKASAPFVATVVDVMGVMLYLGIARLLLTGLML